ncbi:MAG: BlaI/MecI/CopY family transcriptional regulator [Myxococcaceae bacterium]|nr:BlaI/MecI/CopY family transcriptional regulator [Myxococcaceae bacterium]MCI0672444.1 BlaI/MecI/CopY family transcriptional regulator [Myxococcaceae bacterium]
MAKDPTTDLSRRERQILDVIYRLGRATVAEVVADLPDAPSYSAVRALMGIMEEKGQLTHEQDGARYIYLPTVSREKARKGVLKSVVQTFFDGSSRQAIAALLELPESKFSREELDALSALIEKAKKEGR